MINNKHNIKNNVNMSNMIINEALSNYNSDKSNSKKLKNISPINNKNNNKLRIENNLINRNNSNEKSTYKKNYAISENNHQKNDNFCNNLNNLKSDKNSN